MRDGLRRRKESGAEARHLQAVGAAELRGSLKTFEIESKALDARRKLTVYLPPEFGPGRARCVVYAADGEQMDRYACFLSR